MINRLRYQFILSAAVAVLVVLCSVSGVINGTMRGLVYVQTNRVLDALSAWDTGDWTGSTPPPVSGTMLANQFFRVRLDSSGNVSSSDLDHISQLQDSDLDTILASLNLDSGRGRLVLVSDSVETHYAYRIAQTDSGETSIIFLDVTTADMMKAQLLRASLVVASVSFVAFLVILAALSRRAIRPVMANMENQKRFITNAGHELKTPLAIISANTELLEAVHGESEWSRNIVSQVERLSGLIGDLITLSKVSELEQAELTPLALSPMVQSAAGEFLPLVEQRGRRLDTEIAPGLWVEGEQRFLRELVNVLLDNAAKYCDPGGEILVRVEESGKWAVLDISNDYAGGAGVDYTRFFERFYQQEQSHNSEKSGGFGIGLSMAQELVRMMRGKIQVRWAAGRIAFRVMLVRCKPGQQT